MVRRSRDSKFVIYQVLYIFVITVLALKGAELNLGEVVRKDKVVDKSIRDSLIAIVDSLSAQGLKFNIEIDTNVVTENLELKKKLTKLSKKIASLNHKIEEIPLPEKPEPEKPVEDKTLRFPFVKSLTFLKYATNTAENRGDFPVEIYSPENPENPLVVVPPKSSKEFEVGGEDELIVKFGNQKAKVPVKENLPPEITIKKVTTKMDKSDIYVKDLQRTTCFTVTISDERLEQIKVKYSGPISVSKPYKDKKGNLVYNVSLKLANTESRFDDWLERNENLEEPDGRYKVNFFFVAYDTKSKQKVQVGDSFYFTDFAK